MLNIAGEAKPITIHPSRHQFLTNRVPVTLEHTKSCLDLFLHHLQRAPTSSELMDSSQPNQKEVLNTQVQQDNSAMDQQLSTRPDGHRIRRRHTTASVQLRGTTGDLATCLQLSRGAQGADVAQSFRMHLEDQSPGFGNKTGRTLRTELHQNRCSGGWYQLTAFCFACVGQPLHCVCGPCAWLKKRNGASPKLRCAT